jgi:prepilin-type N-terminal cleavage/methylation domain-containing protein
MINKKSTIATGFTIIEVTVVLLIISIVFIAALPVTGKAASFFNLRHTANQMAADIREVQQRALSESCPGYWIDFRTDHYVIKKSGHSVAIIIDAVCLPQGIRIDNTNFSEGKIRFSAEGTPNMGGTVTIRDQKTNKFMFVIVASITGRVRVSDQPPKA